MYAIIRLKAARNAWYWAVHLRRSGKMYYRRFYDLKHQGTKNALAAAIAWRNCIAGQNVFTIRKFHTQRRSNNRSGVAGVHFLRNERQPRGVWQSKIKLPDGRKITKSFSVHKFGRREAFEHAVAARAGMLELIEDRPYLEHPFAKRLART